MGSREFPDLYTDSLVAWSESDPSRVKDLIESGCGIEVDADNGDILYEIRFYKHFEFPVIYLVVSVRNGDFLRLYLFEKVENGASCLQEREDLLPLSEYSSHIEELERGFLLKKGFDIDSTEILPGTLWQFCLFNGARKE